MARPPTLTVPQRAYSPAVNDVYMQGMREAGAALAAGDRRAALFALGAAWPFPGLTTPVQRAVHFACRQIGQEAAARAAMTGGEA